MNKSIERLKNNIYAINLSYDRLIKSIDDRKEADIYVAIGELLLWTLTTDEWYLIHNKGYRNRKETDKDGQVLFGLKHAYNLMKHNMNFYKIHKEEGGIHFPITFPLIIPKIQVVWDTLSEDINGKFKNQEKNYKIYLEGKSVIEVFDKAINYLKREIKKVKEELA